MEILKKEQYKAAAYLYVTAFFITQRQPISLLSIAPASGGRGSHKVRRG